MDTMLDVFKADGFSVISLTDAINKMPFIPGRAGAVIDWQEDGIYTTSIELEEYGGTLKLLIPSERGGPGTPSGQSKRTVRMLKVPHYEVPDKIMADEVQGIRQFGTGNILLTVQDKVNQRMQEHVQLEMDPTLEYMKLGAVKGIILDGDGTTVRYNLFTEFGVNPPAEVGFNLAAAANGALRTSCTGVVRTIAGALGGIPYKGIYAFCSDSFWDALIQNPEVRASYLQQVEAAKLRDGVAYETFSFGGITWENYRGAVGSIKFIDDDKCHIFPVGVPGLWRTVYAPADYVETVNTKGLPRYAKQWPMENGKGINMEMQMNPLAYCTRPGALVKGKLQA